MKFPSGFEKITRIIEKTKTRSLENEKNEIGPTLVCISQFLCSCFLSQGFVQDLQGSWFLVVLREKGFQLSTSWWRLAYCCNSIGLAGCGIEIPENYISRPALESKIQKVYDTRKKSGFSGVKGSGKSSAVAHVLSNKSGCCILLYLSLIRHRLYSRNW
jgi:hypothetical protein